MIGYIEGRLLQKDEDSAIVLTPGGVGYEVRLSVSCAAGLGEPGSTVCLYVSTIVREDAIELFGFEDYDRRQTFELLIEINKLGPKTALAILSCYNPDELREIAFSGTPDSLVSVPGIGKKSAERIFLDLRYRFEGKVGAKTARPTAGLGSAVYRDALGALTNLGYQEGEAAQALRKALEAEPDLDVSAAIRAGLKLLAAMRS